MYSHHQITYQFHKKTYNVHVHVHNYVNYQNVCVSALKKRKSKSQGRELNAQTTNYM